MDTTTRSKPIKLLNTNVITRKGYYDCVITSAGFRDQGAEPKLVVGFEVVKGKCSGFVLHTTFLLSGKGLARLSYLCESVGIRGELSDPSELVGRMVRLRIVPEQINLKGTRRLVHRIVRFHSVDRRGSNGGSVKRPIFTEGGPG